VNCKEAQQLIDGYIDGELDLVRSMEVERHLEDCGSCHQAVKSHRELKSAIRSSSLRFDAPRGMDKRILAAARKECKAAVEKAGRPWWRLPIPATLAFGAASLVLLAFLGWNLFRLNPGAGARELLANEVVSSHVRSLQASHLFDVASTDQHTVKPWFNGKLDYSPPVIDLVEAGFPLTGGRLDYLRGRPVAGLVYRRRQHIINLFVWPSGEGAAESVGGPGSESIHGYYTVHWSRGGMTFYAVSDVNQADLKEFARILTEKMGQ
jgi:anti-sigma factor RsiW